MGDSNNPNDFNNQQNNQNSNQSQYQQPQNNQAQNQQQNNGQQYQQSQYGGQPQNQQSQNGGQPQYQQPQYSGQSQYQQPQYQQNYQQPYNPYQQPQKNNNGMAIGALVCGIVSIVINCCMAWFISLPVAIVGIVLGILTIKNNKDGRTFAIVGIVLSAIGALVGILVIIGCTVVASDRSFWDEFYRNFESSYY